MFQSARLQLTAWYILIIMLVSMTFSAVIYQMLTREVERFDQLQRFRIERRFPDRFPTHIPVVSPELLEETGHRILLFLSIINAGVLTLSGGLSYILAGRTLKPIQEMVDEQNRFISDASHEFRTPLTSLKTSMEVNLRDKNLTLKEAKTTISEGIEDVNKLQSLSDSLLQLAQYQKPNGHTLFESLSLDKTIQEAVRKIQPVAKSKNIHFDLQSNDYEIQASKDGLIDLLVILLDNALKYSPPNSAVEITAGKSDKLMEISVTDHGVGIDPKDTPHVFDRFFRSEISRSKTSASGYGLGLSIAQKIVQVHHGSIAVKSMPGKGSTFTVRLPFFQPSPNKKPKLFS